MSQWQSIINFIKLQRFIQTIDLEKTYESCFDLGDTFEAIAAGTTNKTPKSPLKTSVYIQFLKKLKDKAFARSVNRDDIRLGVQELEVDLEEHIRFVIDALRPVQIQIGLNPSTEAKPLA